MHSHGKHILDAVVVRLQGRNGAALLLDYFGRIRGGSIGIETGIVGEARQGHPGVDIDRRSENDEVLTKDRVFGFTAAPLLC